MEPIQFVIIGGQKMASQVHPEDYDQLIPWKTRLEREIPFLEKVFAEYNVKTILDTSCGTGRHIIELAKKGYMVRGIDEDPFMVEKAKKIAQHENLTIMFSVSKCKEINQNIEGEYDAAICLGDSLALHKRDEIPDCLRELRSSIKKDGIIIIHLRNFKWVTKSHVRYLPLITRKTETSEIVFIRFFISSESETEIHLIKLVNESGFWDMKTHISKLTPIYFDELKDILERVGFKIEKVYGDFKESPFDLENSPQVIIVAKAI